MISGTPPQALDEFVTAYRTAISEGGVPRGVPVGTGRRSAMSMASYALGLTIGQQNVRVRLLDLQRPGWSDTAAAPKAPSKPTKAPPAVTAETEPSAAERREIMSLRDELSRTKKLLRDLDAGQIAMDRVLQMVGFLRDNPQPVPDWLVHPHGDQHTPGTPIFHWSDWHIGETVLPEEVYWRNEFNQDVAEERVRLLVERSIGLAFDSVVKPEYPGAVLVFGGDSVSGQLHEELLATDWCPPTVAAGWCISRKAWAIREMVRAFGRLVIVCVPGNHGRLAKKPWAKRGATACFDHLIFAALREMFEGDDRIAWVIPPDGEALIQVAGTRYLTMHGHELGVKGGDGIIGSLGPIARGAMKVGGAERSVGRDFDILLLGHFHQELWLPAKGIVVGGTLKGFDEYSRRERYRFNPASQLMFFSHPKWGPIMPFTIHLQDPRPMRDDSVLVALEDRAIV